MESSPESGVGFVLMQKEELKEGVIWTAKSLCLKFLYSFFFVFKTVHQYCSPQITILPNKSSCLIIWFLFIFLKKVNKYQKSLFLKSGKLEFPLNLTVKIAGSLT